MNKIYPRKELCDVLELCYKSSLCKRSTLLIFYKYIYEEWEEIPLDIKAQFDCRSKDIFLKNFLIPLCESVEDIKEKIINIQHGFIIID